MVQYSKTASAGMPNLRAVSETARRSSILGAAEKLFGHYGHAKTTIGDIAREAGIGVGSVYLEFNSKDDILAELATGVEERVLRAMRAAARRGSFAERLTGALEARVEAFFELSEAGLHTCDLVFCPAAPVKAAYGRFQREQLALVASLLEQGTRAGEFTVFDVQPTAELVQRAYASLSPPWLFEQDRREALGAVRAMNELLLNGLLARRRPQGPPGSAATRRRRFGTR
ncbi:MAG TPA: TetR/AcrR family transcriptional regulator [Polyangiaceae bacterium]|jgi:AcrR family transcriptional regulator